MPKKSKAEPTPHVLDPVVYARAVADRLSQVVEAMNEARAKADLIVEFQIATNADGQSYIAKFQASRVIHEVKP